MFKHSSIKLNCFICVISALDNKLKYLVRSDISVSDKGHTKHESEVPQTMLANQSAFYNDAAFLLHPPSPGVGIRLTHAIVKITRCQIILHT